MEKLDEQLKKEGSGVHLLRSEKEALRRRILSAEPRQASFWALPSYLWHSRALKASVGAFALLAVVGSPLTYAAQISGPGDLLHGFEVNIIERVEEAVRFSSEAQIDYSTERLEERLQELQDAPAEKLTTARINESNENVQEQAEKVLKTLPQRSDKKDNVRRLVKVSALLNAHEDELAEIHAQSEAVEDASDAVSEELNEQVEEYAEGQSPDSLAEAIQQEVVEIDILVADDPSGTSTGDIENHIEEISDEVRSGDLEGALQAAFDAKVQALSQEYAEEADGQEAN